MTDEELAVAFGVDVRTIYRWDDEHPEFRQVRARGKEAADGKVAERLYHRALGYHHPDTHISTYEGQVTETPIVKHYPPDTQAATWWLKNRQPKRWQDKQSAEITGKDGAPIEVKDVTAVEAARRIAFALTLGAQQVKDES